MTRVWRDLSAYGTRTWSTSKPRFGLLRGPPRTPMAASIQFFPFGPGLHQENDERLQNAGTPRAIENLIRTKNGRLRPRRDYETIAATGTGSTGQGTGALTNLRLYDLAAYGSGIVGFGRADNSTQRSHATDSTQDVFELVEQPTGNWRRAQTGALGQGTRARKVGRLGRKAISIETMDIAAANGYVCTVFESKSAPASASTVAIHVFEAATDRTVFSGAVSGADKPRVVAVGGIFFIGAVVTASGAILLRRFNPASDTNLVALTSPVVVGASISAWDMSPGNDTATFWLAFARSDTTTGMRGMDSAGVVTYSTSSPAVLGDAISIFHHTLSGTQRLHLVIVINATKAVNLYTYLPPATSPATTSLDIFGAQGSITQVGIALDPDAANNDIYLTFVTDAVGPATVARPVDAITHALPGSASMRDTPINSKPISVNNRLMFAALVTEELGFTTHALLALSDLNSPSTYRPVCVWDRFLGHQSKVFHLPQIAYDSSTNLVYATVGSEDTDRRSNLEVMEMRIAGTDRRQTVQLGDVLYIAGAIVQAFDGRHAQEAGGFLTRPFIVTATGNPTGSLGLGLYQMIAVQEHRDAKGRLLQSAPSNLKSFDTSTFADQGIAIGVQPSLTMRDAGSSDEVTPREFQQTPTQAIYRTLNTNNGNGTFHQDLSVPVAFQAERIAIADFLLQSDDAISEKTILYTQGARGALSGPLEFVCPDPCITLAASADRILSGGLPEDSRIQESRPLFPGEQVQWNDTLGFYRDVRNKLLAVARLDERRILWSSSELFECDGPGVDDNGLGEIGAPRRLPSDVGLYGGILGWRSIVEISAGILFQGLFNQIYLLPRGGVTPVPVGFAIEDKLAEYPVIVAAVYMNEDQTVRFFCNNEGDEGGTESIVLLFNVRFTEWFVEGPYAATWRSAAGSGGSLYTLDSAGTVQRQRDEDTPLAFIANAWRSGTVHPFNPGMFGRVHAIWFYGRFLGNCRIRCVVRWDDGSSETHDWVDVFDKDVGDQFAYRFEFNQLKCESVDVDFEIEDFQGEASAGLDYNYWAIEREPSGVPNQLGPESMT